MATPDTTMRQLLAELELTSHGTTPRVDAPGSGGYYQHVVLAGDHPLEDPPHVVFRRLYEAAATDQDREAVIAAARKALKEARVSAGDPSREETKADRDRRIVEKGEGWLDTEVARWARCGVRDVHNARAAAGRDLTWGKPIRNGKDLGAEQLRGEVSRLDDTGMPARQIAMALKVSYSTVLRALGRKR